MGTKSVYLTWPIPGTSSNPTWTSIRAIKGCGVLYLAFSWLPKRDLAPRPKIDIETLASLMGRKIQKFDYLL